MNGLLYTRFYVQGRNLQYFINRLKREKITVFSCRIKGDKAVVTVDSKDGEKFFAISKELCYNTKKVKQSGFLYPFVVLWRNAGIAVGILLFCVITAFTDNMLFSVEIKGSGRIYESEVCYRLEQSGVKKYVLFSSLDLSAVEVNLKSGGCFSFASVKKKGKTLVVEVEKAESSEKPERAELLTVPEDGVIERVKVYRGRALVNAGDSVTAGQVAVTGEMLIGEEWQKTYVVAEITLLAEKTFTVTCSSADSQDYALTLAKESLDGRETVAERCQMQEADGSFVYTVHITYRVRASCG